MLARCVSAGRLLAPPPLLLGSAAAPLLLLAAFALLPAPRVLLALLLLPPLRAPRRRPHRRQAGRVVDLHPCEHLLLDCEQLVQRVAVLAAQPPEELIDLEAPACTQQLGVALARAVRHHGPQRPLAAALELRSDPLHVTPQSALALLKADQVTLLGGEGLGPALGVLAELLMPTLELRDPPPTCRRQRERKVLGRLRGEPWRLSSAIVAVARAVDRRGANDLLQRHRNFRRRWRLRHTARVRRRPEGSPRPAIITIFQLHVLAVAFWAAKVR